VGRVAVLPEGRAADAGADDLVVRLRPGAAFGTAEHPTTHACLDLLQRLVRPGDRVLDLGAGTAILAITAVKAGAASALAVESDRLACHDAEANARLNGVADRVTVVHREARPDDLGAAGPFDLLLANLEGRVLLPLIPTFARILAPGGSAVVGGLVRTERAALLERAADAGLRLIEERRDRGWWSGVLGPPEGR
jgi:ribosomal protein L11 methyltransferase